jgi:thiol-disulfide isomerase/thioredoxin
MAAVSSTASELGQAAPVFDLAIANPWVDELDKRTRSIGDYKSAEVLVIVFTCNHCPYSKHVWPELIRFSNDYEARGVRLVAINPNDAERYPDDSFDRMAEEARERQLPFPYLHDESQVVARAYDAACTPDIYMADKNRRIVYRGRLDAVRPGQGDPDGAELRAAVDELLATGVVSVKQTPSIGCSIKWKQPTSAT